MVCSGGQPVNFTIMNVGELSAEALDVPQLVETASEAVRFESSTSSNIA
jgi:hypothetical protein